MEAHTSCTICNHSYDYAAKRPLVLPCSHSFCQACLELKEAEGNKCCFSCSVTWNDVKVSDLLPCHQPIPLEGQTAKEGGASESASLNGTCGQHDDEYIFWCETCDVPLCKRCLRLEHKGCQFVLIDEKEDILQEQQEAELALLKEKVTKFSAYSVDNEENVNHVRSLVEDLQTLEGKLSEYQTNVEAWQIEAQKKLSEPVKRPCALSQLPKQQDSGEIEELERKIRSRPSSLLMHVAATYQSSLGNVGAFVSALQSRVEDHWEDGPSCDEKQSARDLVTSAAVEALTDGGDWVVSDAVSLAAVKRVLGTTSSRPAKLEIASNNIPDRLLSDLLTILQRVKKYPVGASDTLACFPHSTVPCSVTRSSTTARLDVWTRSASWGSLCRFRGHLDAAAVQKLPATIKCVGLVLRDKEDMAAVHALANTAFGVDPFSIKRPVLRWTGWNNLDLSVATSFRPDFWPLSWSWILYNNPRVTQSLSDLAIHGVHLRLYLPLLVPGDMPWMKDLFKMMLLDGCSIQKQVSLLLPGALIDPDILLGVLRDSGQRLDVHLPANLPQLVPREEMGVRYKKYGNTVIWDLE